MARPLRIEYPGAFYHVMCRGNDRKSIYVADGDRMRFLQFLAESLDTYHVTLNAYVMMHSHFHLVVQTKRANLSEFMRRFNICYTGWFNYTHRRCGHLYQGRYKALLVDADRYLLELSRYVHLNPVRVERFAKHSCEERWRHLQGYRWSSLGAYLDVKPRDRFVNCEMILALAGGRSAHREYILEGLKGVVEDPFMHVKKQMILGDDDFVARVRADHVDVGSVRDQPSYRDLVSTVIDPDRLLDHISKALKTPRAAITRAKVRGSGRIRGIAAELLYKYCGLTEAGIGRLLGGIDYGAVHQLRRRLKRRVSCDPSVRAECERVERELNGLCSK